MFYYIGSRLFGIWQELWDEKNVTRMALAAQQTNCFISALTQFQEAMETDEPSNGKAGLSLPLPFSLVKLSAYRLPGGGSVFTTKLYFYLRRHSQLPETK